MQANLSPMVRLALLSDLETIRAIYNHYVTTSTCTFQIEPSSEEEHRHWFLDRTPAHPVIVAEWEGTVVGWGALSGWKSRCAYAHTVEVTVYIRHDLHRRGIGRLLLMDLIERARSIGHHAILGGACAEQESSVALQRSLGFREVGRFSQVGRKFGRWLDVVYMQIVL